MDPSFPCNIKFSRRTKGKCCITAHEPLKIASGGLTCCTETYLIFFSNSYLFPGWGELSSIQPKSEPAWGEPASPSSTVDNGTSAWGKPPGGVGGWGDGGHEPSGPYGRANGPPGSAPCKPGNIHRYFQWCMIFQYSSSTTCFSSGSHIPSVFCVSLSRWHIAHILNCTHWKILLGVTQVPCMRCLDYHASCEWPKTKFLFSSLYHFCFCSGAGIKAILHLSELWLFVLFVQNVGRGMCRGKEWFCQMATVAPSGHVENYLLFASEIACTFSMCMQVISQALWKTVK